MALTDFETGLAQIIALGAILECEEITLHDGLGRVLAKPLVSARATPPRDISTMDGYALGGIAPAYRLLGEIAAGAKTVASLTSGEAMRIFTGAPIPEGADRVLIQENAHVKKGIVTTDHPPKSGQNIRKKGHDFDQGFTIEAGTRLHAGHLPLIAAMNIPRIHAVRRPKIHVLATGSELVEVGLAKTDFDIVASNAYGLMGLVHNLGALIETALPIQDDLATIEAALEACSDADIIVTTGGASVGDYDFVPEAAKNAGFEIILHKLAIKPGKPILVARRGRQILLGLPGNPVSAMVTAEIFLGSLIRKLLGLDPMPPIHTAILTHALPSNGPRTHFMRASLAYASDVRITPAPDQDSASLRVYADSDALLIRKADDVAQDAGARVNYIPLVR